MTRQEFLKLVVDYGNACFDCGEWQHDKDTTVRYETLYAAQQAAQNALVDSCAPEEVAAEGGGQ